MAFNVFLNNGFGKIGCDDFKVFLDEDEFIYIFIYLCIQDM